MVPCVTYEYNMSPFVSQHTDYLEDKTTAYLKSKNEPNGSVLIIGHTKNFQIKTFKEAYKYTALTFLGDCGGMIGVFIGLSIWSIYTDLIKPIIVKIVHQFMK